MRPDQWVLMWPNPAGRRAPTRKRKQVLRSHSLAKGSFHSEYCGPCDLKIFPFLYIYHHHLLSASF